MNVIGKRVVGNWGAGIAENEGTIYGIRDGHFAMVRWDDCEYAEPDSIFGSKTEYAISSIKEKGCTSKNGSSIGYFIANFFQLICPNTCNTTRDLVL